MLTITEAAKLANISRAAVLKAIKCGRLSATLENNKYTIAESELSRVYKVTPTLTTQVANGSDEVALSYEVKLLKVKLEYTERLLTKSEQENDRLLAMLEHKPVSHETEDKTKGTSRLLDKLFKR
jgi:hypothetical protein